MPVGIVNHDNLLLALYFALSLRAEVSVWSDAAVLEEEREVSLGWNSERLIYINAL